MDVVPVLASSRPDRRRAAAAAVAVLATLALTLAACSSSTPGAGPSSSRGPLGSSTTTPGAQIVARDPQPLGSPAMFSVTGATLLSAAVTGHLHGTPLPGAVQADGVTWVSQDLPTPSASYDVHATVRGSDGSTQVLSGLLRIATLSASQALTYNVTPADGWTVGVNAPIVIRFDKPVQDRAAVERQLVVYSSVPQVGSWHWVGSAEVHFRPEQAWPAHTRVGVVAALTGVRAGPDLWGTSTETVDFSTGDVHLTRVDGLRHTLTVINNGRTIGVWPTSLGRPQFATRTGNYVVLAKEPTRRMTSCNAHIQCTPGAPNFYDLTVMWDVRLTYSGTFIHSAPWSVHAQGVENVSHGCVNLSPAHAQTYFGWARYGDLVTVTGTSRGPADLLQDGDPGMADWNETWAQYVGGSALGAAVTTLPLASA
jgi:lipoprotein-anchoring transpeptidase ErfK/SrfK